MKVDGERIDALAQRILLDLDSRGCPTTTSELKHIVDDNDKIRRRLNKLESVGWVQTRMVEQDDGVLPVTEAEITDAGRESIDEFSIEPDMEVEDSSMTVQMRMLRSRVDALEQEVDLLKARNRVLADYIEQQIDDIVRWDRDEGENRLEKFR